MMKRELPHGTTARGGKMMMRMLEDAVARLNYVMPIQVARHGSQAAGSNDEHSRTPEFRQPLKEKESRHPQNRIDSDSHQA